MKAEQIKRDTPIIITTTLRLSIQDFLPLQSF
jgi:hypothetical protein